jgi:hypothetical protein
MTTEIDREPQALYRMLADRFAQIERAPGVDIGAGQDVHFQRVDTSAVIEAKQDVVHSWRFKSHR